MTLGLAEALAGQVWGQGFPAPMFEGEFTVVEQRLVGGKHTKLELLSAGVRFDAIAFNDPGPFPTHVQIVFRPDLNHYLGVTSLQLVVEHRTPVE